MTGCLLRELFPELPAGMDRRLEDLTLDSRRVRPGSLFLAKQGSQAHGLAYFDEVVKRGAAAIAAEPGGDWDNARIATLGEKAGLPVFAVEGLGMRASGLASAFFGHPSAALRMIGITGTNGKTSISHAIAHALGAIKKTAIVGTLGNGLPGRLQAATHTTPDAVELQRLLAGFRDQGVEAVAMEVSSHALDQGRVAGVRFDRAVFTNLTRDHLDYHGDMASYGVAKARLFAMPLSTAILNGDDPEVGRMAAGLRPETRLLVYGMGAASGLEARADGVLRADSVETAAEGLRIGVTLGGSTGLIQSRWLGRFNASNLLAVLAVLLEEGMGFEQAIRALAQVAVVPGRMEPFGGGDRPLMVVDYAHTPDALEKVLLALREHCAGQLFCVFGCGGDRDRGKRPLMGQAAERWADWLVLTDDNPRGEDGGRIIEDIQMGMVDPSAALVERDRGRAFARVLEVARPGDIIAVCGKGHETTQQIGDQIRPFSDRAEVERLLAL
ncbi:MAG: UDP-N-acetylmuramoyl-L-alanyl-D-glutamate--2,6-diaminopimelate ligase [Gammaproteobacteria bacterium]|nr:UDP-N-acetylmuramoyl-L-alanyl-D-glutamate--2,6-diaminopimelate ligase [Gammaproteobacteria bacterium]MBU1654204.1 UDP-N-acetylmuramoyl-L-alanyl-D-glutamate--2,6-diaminopimelate ligase [Gammaproteobacteria bacterium]MBU1960864.1 UDP-N-acetylmuramoyl-L-alanyl-D-glutamate--2,6-diaminopimelate ligase [Gammaproteobacteria bacterium]